MDITTPSSDIIVRAAGSLLPHHRHEFEAVPSDLRALPHWVVFDQIPQGDGKKPKKIPYTPGTNRKASVNDPATWGTYDEAVADAERTGRLPGLAITPAMNLTLIDDDGHIADELVERFDSYSERSVNGGLHILVRGRPPAGFVAHSGIEVYPRTGNRFVVLTGDIIGGRGTIEDRTALLAEWFPPAQKPTRTATPFANADDRTIIERVLRMPKGRQLHGSGDMTGYKSGSEADFGLLNAYIAAGATSAERLNALYRQSALYHERQERWDDDRYRERTITSVLDGTVQPWDGWDKPKSAVSDEQTLPIAPDACAWRVADLERQLAEAKATIAAQAATIETLKCVQSSNARILANRALGPARVVASTLATQLAWRATADDPPGEVRTPPPPGMMKLSVADIAKAAGISEKSAGTHLSTLAEQGIIRRMLKTTAEPVDTRTGEIYDEPVYITSHFVGPAGAEDLTPESAVAFAEDVASFTVERVERRGGKRIPRCPHHPDAKVARRWTANCGACGEQLYPAPGEIAVDEIPAMLLEPAPAERTANFADYNSVAEDVLLPPKTSNHSRAERIPNFAERASIPAEPVWIDAPPTGTAGDDRWTWA